MTSAHRPAAPDRTLAPMPGWRAPAGSSPPRSAAACCCPSRVRTRPWPSAGSRCCCGSTPAAEPQSHAISGLLPTRLLTRAADEVAQRRLSPALLNHSYRTYAYGAALGELHDVDVDHELLYAAALLHDVGLPTPVPRVDFTRASAQVARDVAEDVGLSTAATDVLRDAITLHHTPGVTLAQGPVAFLLSAGAGLDVVGLRAWELPSDQIAEILAEYPRVGFKREFAAAFRAEAQQVPSGRGAFLTRYGAFSLAIKAAPFRG